jgi:hypothetical protein
MITLIRKLFWLGLFLAFTLGFVTLFDHGFVTSKQFTADAKGEVNDLMAIVHPIKRPTDKTDQPAQ